MRKSEFKRLVDKLFKQKAGFIKMLDNPAGSKMYNRSLPSSKRGCDGTLRR
jgi:hypothetical protein